jgi:sulfite reductase (ferredoxin)
VLPLTSSIDASPVAREIAHHLTANSEFYNLPRKFKISATGCPSWCTYPEINDIGLTPAVRGGEVGYSLRVGGGLSNEPHIAVRLDAFVRPDQAVRVAQGVAEIFRDQQVLRESRDRARLKYLFMREGWTAESFLDELNRRIGFKLDPAVPEEIPDDSLRDHVGIHPQRQPGLAYVGASVLRGRLTGEQLEAVADLAERFGSGLAARHRLAESRHRRRALREDRRVGARAGRDRPARGSFVAFWRGAIACTGTEFCKLAITETKGFTRWLVDELEERLPQFDQQLKLHVTGCPNGCGQHWIADIGLEGKKIKHEGKLTDALLLLPGRSGGRTRGYGAAGGLSLPAPLVPEAIERLLRNYLGGRESGKRACARGLRATATTSCARSLRARFWSRWSATCRRGACRTLSRSEKKQWNSD